MQKSPAASRSRVQHRDDADRRAAQRAPADAAARERELHIERLFDAPPAVVFRAWTDPQQAERWYAPKGFTVEQIRMDVRVGGAWRKCMRSPEGVEYWRHGVYREVAAPHRLVFTYVSDDPFGTPGHETLVTIDFLDRGAKTLMVFRQALFESVATRDSHRGGWGEALQRLGAWVQGAPA